MSTPLIMLAAILAIFALGLIPFMMVKNDRQRKQAREHSHAGQGKKHHKKKKKH